MVSSPVTYQGNLNQAWCNFDERFAESKPLGLSYWEILPRTDRLGYGYCFAVQEVILSHEVSGEYHNYHKKVQSPTKNLYKGLVQIIDMKRYPPPFFWLYLLWSQFSRSLRAQVYIGLGHLEVLVMTMVTGKFIGRRRSGKKADFEFIGRRSNIGAEEAQAWHVRIHCSLAPDAQWGRQWDLRPRQMIFFLFGTKNKMVLDDRVVTNYNWLQVTSIHPINY